MGENASEGIGGTALAGQPLLGFLSRPLLPSVIVMQPGTPYGAPRPYVQALAENVIDSRIRCLVDSLNVVGVCSTFASCEGHGFISCLAAPYVVFESGFDFAQVLSMYLEQDAARVKPHLHYYWIIGGFFDRQGSFRFRLAPGQEINGWWPSARKKLERDFRTLSDLVKVLTERWQADPAKFESQAQEQHDETGQKQSPEFPFLGCAFPSKWIAASAGGTKLRACADGVIAFLAVTKCHLDLLNWVGAGKKPL